MKIPLFSAWILALLLAPVMILGQVPGQSANQGSIEGTILSFEDKPMAGVPVWATRSAVGTEEKRNDSIMVTSMADGRFRFNGLPLGSYVVRADILRDSQRLSVERMVTLKQGEKAILELAFSRYISVGGRISFNGAPPKAGTSAELVSLEDTDNRTPLKLDATGSFDSFIEEGVYRLAITSQPFGLSILDEPIAVSKESGGSLNLDLPGTRLDVFIVPPENAWFKGGILSTEFRTFGNSEVARIALAEPFLSIDQVLPGSYRLAFTSEGGLQGQSTGIEVGRMKDNRVRIDLGIPMEKTYMLEVVLPVGEYEYKFFSPSDNWTHDVLNPMSRGEGVMTNSAFSIPGGAVDIEGTRSQWPKVDDDSGMVTFKVTMPALSDEVYVRGAFNNWSIDPKFLMKPVDSTE